MDTSEGPVPPAVLAPPPPELADGYVGAPPAQPEIFDTIQRLGIRFACFQCAACFATPILLRAHTTECHANDTTPSCAVCGTEQDVTRCGRCKSIFYCGRAHQSEHWKVMQLHYFAL